MSGKRRMMLPRPPRIWPKPRRRRRQPTRPSPRPSRQIAASKTGNKAVPQYLRTQANAAAQKLSRCDGAEETGRRRLG